MHLHSSSYPVLSSCNKLLCLRDLLSWLTDPPIRVLSFEISHCGTSPAFSGWSLLRRYRCTVERFWMFLEPVLCLQSARRMNRKGKEGKGNSISRTLLGLSALGVLQRGSENLENTKPPHPAPPIHF